MAAPPSAPKTGKTAGRELPAVNFVGNDQIWRDHCDQERVKAKCWDRNWGFMKQGYKDVIREDLPKLTNPNRPKAEAPPHLRIPPATPISKYINVKPSPPVPSTDSKMIGWRSGQGTLNLERYGRYVRPMPSILRQLRWPPEAVS